MNVVRTALQHPNSVAFLLVGQHTVPPPFRIGDGSVRDGAVYLHKVDPILVKDAQLDGTILVCIAGEPSIALLARVNCPLEMTILVRFQSIPSLRVSIMLSQSDPPFLGEARRS